MKVIKSSDGMIMFYCPGCECLHGVNERWQFNGDFEKPTISPSILTRNGHFEPNFTGSCWCTFNKEHRDDPAPFECKLCHIFVTDGKIQYLNDCSHSLAGQTIDLLDEDKWFEDEE